MSSKVSRPLLILVIIPLILSACSPARPKPDRPKATEGPGEANPTTQSESIKTDISGDNPLESTEVGAETAPPSSEMPAEFLDRYTIIQKDHPEAVCNDGTTPVFYYRRGVGDGALKWVIWFKGGGSAHSRETFRGRGKNVTSSDPWMTEEWSRLGTGGNPNSPDGEANGILSSSKEDNPDFFNWNHVYMVYCSSDGWTGTRAASTETGGIHFQGHNIVNAIIDALSKSEVIGTPNLLDASHVLLTGSSAGANGLRAHVDRLAGVLSHADVRAISDAGVFFFTSQEMTSRMDEMLQEQHAAWQPVLDEDCQTVHQSSGNSWLCLSGGYLVQNGFINTPMFIHQDQSDVKIVEALEASNVDVQSEIEAIGLGIRELLAGREGVFSPNTNRHIILNNARFYRYTLRGVTMVQVLGNWYFSRPGPTNVIATP